MNGDRVNTIVLSREELIELTGKKQRGAQREVLVALGIEHKVRPDGEILVSRTLVDQVLGVTIPRSKSKAEHEPNWAAIAPKK